MNKRSLYGRILLSFALVLSLSPLALLSTSVGSIGIADAAAFADSGEVKVVAASTHDGGVVDGPHRVGSFELGTSEAIEEAPLGFVYFDEATPVAGTEQKIAIAIDDQGATIRSAALLYETPLGEERAVESQTCAGASTLFSLQVDDPGDYRLLEMQAQVETSDGQEKLTKIDLAENGEDCSFEVKQDEGSALSAMVEDEAGAANESEEIETTIYALGVEGDVEAADDIDDALIVAQEASAFAMARAAGLVIALDPGHGGNDSGAVGSGLKESDVNWKIAQACKAELENYAGVTVVLTRTQNECPTLYERVERAVNQGAKVFVSLHINSTERSSADGAEVYYPNDSSYNKAAHETGKQLSQNILDELTALGLQDRGIKVRNSENNSKYPDGSLRDYYGVIADAREMGIPGIIVEHAFITNPEDNAKLKDDNFLKKLGMADAQGIAKTYGLNKGGWEHQSDGTWKFKKVDGSYSKGWEYINGSWYYLDPSTAVMKTGWQTIGNAKYYLNPSGAMQEAGWLKQGNDWYWITASGAAATDWTLVNGVWYYMDLASCKMQTTGWFKHKDDWYWITGSGAAATGWVLINGSWYYMDPTSCKMQTGWTTVGSDRYYLHPSGAMQGGGWFKDGNDWYWITPSGAAAKGWAVAYGSWYYMDPGSCKMQTGWTTVGSDRYYLHPSGAMQGGGWFKDGNDWYWITPSGAAAKGWAVAYGSWYYMDPTSCKMQTGWTTVGSDRYYLHPSGAMQGGGWFKDGNDWYWITPSGAAAKGWAVAYGSWYYMDPGSCKMQTGWKKLGSTWYYLHDSGVMATGWLKLGDTWYYLHGSGAMATGWLTLGEAKYYLDSSGAMVTGERTIDGEQCFFESSGAFVGNGTPIMGASKTTVAAMTQAYERSGLAYPSTALGAGGAPNAATFCQMIYEESNAEGVRAEVIFAQIMNETGWLQFGGDVSINQFNFGGIGATGNGVPGNSFKDVRTGIRAQVQHLKAYASTEPLKNTCVDPRFNYVSRGCAKFVEWLGIGDNPTGQGWCAGSGYGAKLKDIMKRNLGI